MDAHVISFFRKTDPVLFRSVKNPKDIRIHTHTDPLLFLVEQIINQQLSTQAGEAIYYRFLRIFPTKKISAKVLLDIPTETLRGIGISEMKVSYIRNVAAAHTQGMFTKMMKRAVSDEDAVSFLMDIKGIGRWTAELFTMFVLGRPDICCAGDVGLQRAVRRLYTNNAPVSEKELRIFSKRWSPFRTYACLLLWKSLENVV